MIGLPLLIATAFLLYGCSAKPYSSPVKVGEDQYQETLKSEELSRKMSLGLKEVEPPEDMAVSDDDVHPDMAIWKAVQWSKGRKHVVSEVDEDDLYHPALVPAPEPPAHTGPEEAYQDQEPDLDYEFYAFPDSELREPEEDVDDVYHRSIPDQSPRKEPQAEQKPPRRVVHTQPEEDVDDVYHRSIPDQSPRKEPQAEQKPPRRVVHTQPEEDRDDVYHRDVPSLLTHPQAQVQPKPLTRITYTHPEEDRDHLYHN